MLVARLEASVGVGVGGLRLGQLPAGVLLDQHAALAAGRQPDLVHLAGLDREHFLVLRRPGRGVLRIDEVDVGAEPHQDQDPSDHGAHIRSRRIELTCLPVPAVDAGREHQSRQDEHREQEDAALASAVSVSRRSSGSRGRMAIRFSCCASQFTVFRKKSRLPCTPRMPLLGKSESPITTSRDSGLRRLSRLPGGRAPASASGVPARRSPARTRPRRAKSARPCRPCRR